MKTERILVPLDGSPLAEAALTAALDFGRGGATTLMLLRAAEAHTLPGADPTDEQVTVVREAEEYLAAVADRLARQGVTGVETSVWYGPAAAAIIEAAKLKKADLVVMGTHGRSGLGRFILGSVTESVLRGTTTPICIVREPTAPIEPPKGVAKPRQEKDARV
ncbi:MAG TPA: universal stress protein [Methylomirabilota bacterium]